jgi:hypothetical protein
VPQRSHRRAQHEERRQEEPGVSGNSNRKAVPTIYSTSSSAVCSNSCPYMSRVRTVMA